MAYRALLVFDYGDGYDSNAFQRMESALVNLQWVYCETSAFSFDQPEGMSDNLALTRIWQGLACVARSANAIGGRMSAISFQAVYSDPAKNRQIEFGSAKNPTISYSDISQRRYPGDARPGN